MPIIRNCEIYFARLDPKYPNRQFNKENPTWELQIRTKDRDQKKEWEELKLPIKVIDDEKEGVFYRVNLKKPSKKASGEASAPVEVVDLKMNDIDPRTIGNGSIGNIRIFQYEYDKGGKKATASILTGVQIKKYIKYTPKLKEEFDSSDEDTEIIDNDQDSGEKEMPDTPKDKEVY